MAEAAKSISPPNTAYQFDVSCRALSGDRSLQAHLLKVTSPSALPQIFNNAMSASMLVDIVKCVATFFRSATRVLKKKKLKINVHRPVGTRVVFDEEGNTQAPLAMLADKTNGDILLDQGVVEDSISSSWKSQGLALLQVECYLMLHSMVVYLSRNLN
ncbi:hypothetical protein V6Z11_D10G123300 [Gossypium hirsutum]|uniref:RNA-polymerase II-associated protein 3-like C-terminal domain-containing protein n=1 Tax=Gossypium hirsutum TaxID=3635 RepID=A0A1U8K8T8_GOSHI|nr:uncharacterized protein LOC107914490 [Gossypium hirsutum]XP_040958079.1 uncharacterized protein LOC107914490 [Gossypium hirsutum]XP_040958080.1 uncharacterized protein LOC107914490 [Gossypium hirsutum]XP_040958081.1 uncharacterized protein LOC107914490 [Gossypium hirsutum]